MLCVWLSVGKVAVFVRSLQKLRIRCFCFEVTGADKALSSVHVQRFATLEPFSPKSLEGFLSFSRSAEIYFAIRMTNGSDCVRIADTYTVNSALPAKIYKFLRQSDFHRF